MDVIFYRSGYKYQLARDYRVNVGIKPTADILVGPDNPFISLQANGDLIILAGYAWDGPSGPALDTKNFMRGSLVHDALYQLMRLCLLDCEYRRDADQILYRICREDGMWLMRAKWVYYSVRMFAYNCCRSQSGRPILEAP